MKLSTTFVTFFIFGLGSYSFGGGIDPLCNLRLEKPNEIVSTTDKLLINNDPSFVGTMERTRILIYNKIPRVSGKEGINFSFKYPGITFDSAELPLEDLPLNQDYYSTYFNPGVYSARITASLSGTTLTFTRLHDTLLTTGYMQLFINQVDVNTVNLAANMQWMRKLNYSKSDAKESKWTLDYVEEYGKVPKNIALPSEDLLNKASNPVFGPGDKIQF